METERQVTRSEFESVAAGARQALGSNQPSARIPFGGTELVFERTEEGGLTLSAPHAAVPSALFVDPVDRPETYPPQLPFVAGEVVTIDDSGGPRTVLWWAPRDPTSLLRELHELSVASGWALESERDMPEQSAVQRAYTRGDAQRFVLKSDGAVTLIDRERGGFTEGAHCRI